MPRLLRWTAAFGLAALVVLPFPTAAQIAQRAIFPDNLGALVKGKTGTVAVSDQALYSEYGFETTEQAEYSSPDKSQEGYVATAWRLKDSTGALAVFQLQRPSAATPSKLASLAVQTKDQTLLAYGNYVFQFTGGAPAAADLQTLYDGLPKLEESPLPVLIGFLPTKDLVPNSERYVIGPVSLERFDPVIPPSVAAFHLGSEAATGKYKIGKDLITLAIFNYPTPSMAREQAEGYQKIPGAIVKRTGSLVAVTVAPTNPDAAERVLAQVNYRTNLTWSEKVPTNEIKGMATLLVNIFALSGLLVLISLIVGVGFGGFRVLRRKLGGGREPDAMIVLNLGDK